MKLEKEMVRWYYLMALIDKKQIKNELLIRMHYQMTQSKKAQDRTVVYKNIIEEYCHE